MVQVVRWVRILVGRLGSRVQCPKWVQLTDDGLIVYYKGEW